MWTILLTALLIISACCSSTEENAHDGPHSDLPLLPDVVVHDEYLMAAGFVYGVELLSHMSSFIPFRYQIALVLHCINVLWAQVYRTRDSYDYNWCFLPGLILSVLALSALVSVNSPANSVIWKGLSHMLASAQFGGLLQAYISQIAATTGQHRLNPLLLVVVSLAGTFSMMRLADDGLLFLWLPALVILALIFISRA